jgi:catechol 2,3-dioxygenase-like lactoylglutathione lyase family enzyme
MKSERAIVRFDLRLRQRQSVMLAAGLGIGLATGLARAQVAHAEPALAAKPAAPAVEAVGAIGLTVGDLDRSLAFYRDVLSFRVVVRQEESTGAPLEDLEGVFGAHVRSARLQLGGEAIVLTQYLAPRGRPIPIDARSNDRSFQHIAIVVADMARAYRLLRAHRVHYVSTEPQTLPRWNQGAAGIRAFYFADPDDHTLELIWFPAGKGDPRWQRSRPGLFLGIDHTAIGVGDTERSLRFYRDVLGLHVTGAGENSGTEQEHLNNVAGAHLRITGLHAGSGPGIELLEYLAPRDGRPPAPDLQANDLAHWQTVLIAPDVGAATGSALAAGGTAISPRVVERLDAAVGIHRGQLIRDPDGHGLLIAQ